MSEYATKIIPYELFEVELAESWFDAMARDGLVLQTVGIFGAKFKRTNPCHTQFRIDYSPGMNLKKDSARRILLKEAGWQYVANSGPYIVYKSEDASINELPEKITPKGNTTLQALLALPFGLLSIFFMVSDINELWDKYGNFSELIQSGFWIFLVANVLLLICFIMFLISGYLALGRKHKRKVEGEIQARNDETIRREKILVIIKSIPIYALLLATFIVFVGSFIFFIFGGF